MIIRINETLLKVTTTLDFDGKLSKAMRNEVEKGPEKSFLIEERVVEGSLEKRLMHQSSEGMCNDSCWQDFGARVAKGWWFKCSGTHAWNMAY